MEKATERQKILIRHLNPLSSSPSLPSINDNKPTLLSAVNCAAELSPMAAFGDDVVIVAAYRTAICKAKRGGFKDTLPDDLLASVLKVKPYLACSIGAGVESMSIDHTAGGGFHTTNPRAQEFRGARDCLLPMGITSENVAERYCVTREDQDMAAVCFSFPLVTYSCLLYSHTDSVKKQVESHKRAAAANASGKLKDEIVPVATKIVDPDTKAEKPIVVSVDDGVRPNSNMADLAKLKTVFKPNGSTTAVGNASQISDGAGAVLLMKRSLAMKKGLPILGIFRSFAVTGVDPAVMGIGPAYAIPAAANLAGLKVSDIDLFEINEAFASQYVYCCKKLELDVEKVNVNGGAIAIGHPLGATGARCVATLLHEMKRRGKDCRFGVISMCIGTGMGAAAVFERGDSVDDLSNARVETNGSGH
ncbi:hypothetical protein HID58_049397 [Brassica napus]|uniref:acetyl-CoA C-acyltransferase n=1 Tax=Brassica napus TaxID=3708 RepID=A0ABQ8B4W6_BRANA|nr:hypothetical protein HID58_049397 [Brassica napus]